MDPFQDAIWGAQHYILCPKFTKTQFVDIPKQFCNKVYKLFTFWRQNAIYKEIYNDIQ